MSTEVTKTKTDIEGKFASAKAKCLEMSTTCKNLSITDETSFALATQILINANDHLTFVEKERVRLKKPSLDEGKLIDEVAKELKTPLETGINEGKRIMKVYTDAQAVIAKAAEAARQEQIRLAEEAKQAALETAEFFKNRVIKQNANLLLAINACVSVTDCDSVIKQVEAWIPSSDKYGEFVGEADKVKADSIALLISRKANIEFGVSTEVLNNSLQDQSAITESLETKQEAIAQATTQQLAPVFTGGFSAMSNKNVKDVIKWEVVDASLVPREFMVIHDPLVNSYAKKVKTNLDFSGKEWLVENGIRYYLDTEIKLK